ncbi:MAG: type II toxin-antitoxin system VapC family toxin [Rhodobacteraceae bacterium]|nr:type II toxin-antitoxin system VapC family toxin [Paracoccaceae bacterium]
MSALLLDTHARVRSLSRPSQISPVSRSLIQRARKIHVAPCGLHEIAWKHHIGKWPEVGALLAQFPDFLRAQNGRFAPYTAKMALLAGTMDWRQRDPFDRMIAATAIELCCPPVSKDRSFDGPESQHGWCGRIWN